MQPFPTEQTIQTAGKSVKQLWDIIVGTLNGLDIHLDFDAEEKKALGFAKENVWSRAARRKRTRERADVNSHDAGSKGAGYNENEEVEGQEAALRFRLVVSEGNIHLRWLEGMDSRLFESFIGMLNRAINPR